MKINKKQLEAYRKTHGREIFSTKEYTYDIVIAQFSRRGHDPHEDTESYWTPDGDHIKFYLCIVPCFPIIWSTGR